MEKIYEITPLFCENIPENLEGGIIYISEKYNTSIHLCACGCGEKTVLPFNKTGEWNLINRDGKITIMPSIGNFSYENPNYHAHYFITENEIKWC